MTCRFVKKFGRRLIWLIIIAGLSLSYALLAHSKHQYADALWQAEYDGLYVDEPFHIAQITKFLNKDFSVAKIVVTMIPTYHFMIHGILYFKNAVTAQDMRFVSFLISILCVPVFFLLARHFWDENTALHRTLQFTFLPIVFFLFPLIYTDLWALLFVLLMLLAALKERVFIAALCGTMAVAIRQPNIIWVGFVWLLLLDDYTFAAITKWLCKTWSFIVLFCAFGVFVVMNGGVAIAAGDLHEIGIYLGNVWFFLLFFFLISLPYVGKWIKEAISLAQKDLLLALIGMGGIWIFILGTYSVEHPCNRSHFFLGNILFNTTAQNMFTKTLVAVPMAIGLFGFLRTRFAQTRFVWLIPATFVSLLAMPLVTSRYYIVPLSLYLALRNPEDKRSEIIQTCLFIVVSLGIVVVISRKMFFV